MDERAFSWKDNPLQYNLNRSSTFQYLVIVSYSTELGLPTHRVLSAIKYTNPTPTPFYSAHIPINSSQIADFLPPFTGTIVAIDNSSTNPWYEKKNTQPQYKLHKRPHTRGQIWTQVTGAMRHWSTLVTAWPLLSSAMNQEVLVSLIISLTHALDHDNLRVGPGETQWPMCNSQSYALPDHCRLRSETETYFHHCLRSSLCRLPGNARESCTSWFKLHLQKPYPPQNNLQRYSNNQWLNHDLRQLAGIHNHSAKIKPIIK